MGAPAVDKDNTKTKVVQLFAIHAHQERTACMEVSIAPHVAQGHTQQPMQRINVPRAHWVLT